MPGERKWRVGEKGAKGKSLGLKRVAKKGVEKDSLGHDRAA